MKGVALVAALLLSGCGEEQRFEKRVAEAWIRRDAASLENRVPLVMVDVLNIVNESLEKRSIEYRAIYRDELSETETHARLTLIRRALEWQRDRLEPLSHSVRFLNEAPVEVR